MTDAIRKWKEALREAELVEEYFGTVVASGDVSRDPEYVKHWVRMAVNDRIDIVSKRAVEMAYAHAENLKAKAREEAKSVLKETE